jgi:hypothetical protein
MAAKKKTKKKHTKLKKTAAKNGRPVKKTVRKKLAKKKAVPKRKLAKKKSALKKAAAKTKALGKKTTSPRTGVLKKRVPGKNQSVDTEAFALEGLRARSEGQSGDLQGLSNIEGADSESVEELLEEGNAFEADVVMGVEDAGDAEGREVSTHEVPQDDVPGEYLDKK